jgi:hypothetical protein
MARPFSVQLQVKESSDAGEQRAGIHEPFISLKGPMQYGLNQQHLAKTKF